MHLTIHGTTGDEGRPCTIEVRTFRGHRDVDVLIRNDHGALWAAVSVDRDQLAVMLAEATALGVIAVVGNDGDPADIVA